MPRAKRRDGKYKPTRALAMRTGFGDAYTPGWASHLDGRSRISRDLKRYRAAWIEEASYHRPITFTQRALIETGLFYFFWLDHQQTLRALGREGAADDSMLAHHQNIFTSIVKRVADIGAPKKRQRRADGHLLPESELPSFEGVGGFLDTADDEKLAKKRRKKLEKIRKKRKKALAKQCAEDFRDRLARDKAQRQSVHRYVQSPLKEKTPSNSVA